MSVESFSPEQTITVTDTAAEHFAKQLNVHKTKAIRLSLKEAGCTGFKYVIDEVDGAEKTDVKVTLQNGVDIFVDSEHLSEFQGMVIDVKVEGLNKQLVLDNPNVKNACGCGESVGF